MEDPINFCLQRIQSGEFHPSIIAGAASVAFKERKYSAARLLFQTYLKLVPNASNRKQIRKTMIHASMHQWIAALKKAMNPPGWGLGAIIN
jgi:hypothetical protein